jgi:hypothetical protein
MTFNKTFACLLFIALFCCCTSTEAQRKKRKAHTLTAEQKDRVESEQQARLVKYIYFPHSMQQKSIWSVGFTATTMPLDITEELRFRIPAGDVHSLHRISEHWNISSRLNFQILQNLVSVGPAYTRKLSPQLNLGIGADGAFWFGFVNTQGLKTKGSGWQLYPHVSLGHKFNKELFLTFRAESILNFGVKTYAGEKEVASEYPLFSGSAFSLILEQPFSGRVNLSLGFRAIYTNFFWQTWTLFEAFDRNLFFPQIVVAVIL